ncbi:MAG: hypothetical protein H6719_28770 [Sandaracinaceae bacterium]|nr:hypothetical protein [Sandaracinaceae bacterium]
MLNRFVYACALGALLFACGSREEAPPPRVAPPPQVVDHYSGHWRGLARVQSTLPGAPQQMDVSMTITANNPGQCGSFEYGSIGCSGVWNCLSSFDSPQMDLQETVRFGGERCPQGAQVLLRATDNPRQIFFSYRNAAIAAEGTLERGDMGR